MSEERRSQGGLAQLAAGLIIGGVEVVLAVAFAALVFAGATPSRLGDGIGEDELDRCKAGAKSALIMQQESTRARAGSLASRAPLALRSKNFAPAAEHVRRLIAWGAT